MLDRKRSALFDGGTVVGFDNQDSGACDLKTMRCGHYKLFLRVLVSGIERC